MNYALGGLAFLAAVMLLTLAGCAPNKQLRTSYAPFDPNNPKDTSSVVEAHDGYTMGFVEFDDQGAFWDPAQRLAVEQMIRSEAGITDLKHPSPQSIVLVAFVHGWKDNAVANSDGVNTFAQILKEINANELAAQQHNIHAARKVVGVYIAWRGLSAEWEPFKELSFWTRKDTAHKVGGYGAMTQLLVDLENIQKDSLGVLPATAPRTELVIIGHSFGGAVVYSALSQIITERFINSIGDEKHQHRLKPLGDQVILLNPAFEAQRHFDLNQMALAIQHYPDNQRPVLSIFTSEGDWATHYFFPIGRWLGTRFESYRSRDEEGADITTIGWYAPFITHRLCYHDNLPPLSAASAAPTSAPAGGHAMMRPLSVRGQALQNVQHLRDLWQPNAPVPKQYPFSHATLNPMGTYHPGDPFFIVSVDPKIMNGHSDIANCNLINFLGEYIEFARWDVKDHQLQ